MIKENKIINKDGNFNQDFGLKIEHINISLEQQDEKFV